MAHTGGRRKTGRPVSRTVAREGVRKESTAALVRFRHIVVAALVLSVAVLGPLFTVWKQVYMREICIRREILGDSLAVLEGDLVRLARSSKQLGQIERIERIARSRLGLVYPSSGQIVIVTAQQQQKARAASRGGGWNILAIIRRSLSGEQS